MMRQVAAAQLSHSGSDSSSSIGAPAVQSFGAASSSSSSSGAPAVQSFGAASSSSSSSGAATVGKYFKVTSNNNTNIDLIYVHPDGSVAGTSPYAHMYGHPDRCTFPAVRCGFVSLNVALHWA